MCDRFGATPMNALEVICRWDGALLQHNNDNPRSCIGFLAPSKGLAEALDLSLLPRLKLAQS